MYSNVKALALFLGSPLTLVLVLLFTGIYFLWMKPDRKVGSILVSIGSLVLLLFTFPLIPDVLLGRIEQSYEPVRVLTTFDKKNYNDIQYIVVLAGGHVLDCSIPVTSQFTYDGLVRLIEGIRLYQYCKTAKLIVSGGRGADEISDADLMSELAVQLGVDKGDIILESNSVNTYHEAILLRGLLKKNKFFLVTSAYHMPRAMALFESLGMKPIAAPTGYYVKHNDKGTSVIPDGKNLTKSNILLYEALGYMKAKALGRL
jgi:uncharacterized SAM-binding protein YcdF (DUF218 family)